MPDPTVHITNGIPDLGTGNITTLGMTLVDGANATLGAITDAAIVAGAAGTMNAHLRSISRDIVGGIVLATGSNNIGSVTQGAAPWSQNVTQFGGNAIATGTGIGGLGIPRVTVSSDSSLSATQGGTWNINNISGIINLPSGASTSAKQPALGTAGVPSADVITVQGVSGGTVLPVTGAGGTFPITAASPLAVTQSGTWNINNISGTISLPTGAATVAKQPQPTAAGTPSTDILSVQGNASMIPLQVTQSGNWTVRNVGNTGAVLDAAQNAAAPANAFAVGAVYNSGGVAITSGNQSALQITSTGSLHTTVDNNLVVSTISGVVSTKPDGSAWALTGTSANVNVTNTTIPAVKTLSAATNGLTYSRVNSAATTNATSLKASAGQIIGLDVFNVAAYMVFLKLYNKASAPTVGTDVPVWTIPIAAGGGFSLDESVGEYFSTGIAYAITKLQADSDTTAVAAGDVTGRVKWI